MSRPVDPIDRAHLRDREGFTPPSACPGSGLEVPDLARVAVDLRYADQAHFTRDFKTVTGLTPGEFARDSRTNQRRPS